MIFAYFSNKCLFNLLHLLTEWEFFSTMAFDVTVVFGFILHCKSSTLHTPVLYLQIFFQQFIQNISICFNTFSRGCHEVCVCTYVLVRGYTKSEWMNKLCSHNSYRCTRENEIYFEIFNGELSLKYLNLINWGRFCGVVMNANTF